MKHIHRFFVADTLSPGGIARLGPDDSFHAARVLRLRPGDPLELAGSDGRVFKCVVTLVDDLLEARAEEEIQPPPAVGVELTVAQSLPSGKKMDLIVEKLSEIGVARLVPLYSEKSVRRPGSGSGEKLERWRRIARAAAGQSRQSRVMVVDEPLQLGDWLGGYTETLIALTTEVEGIPLGQAVAGATASLALLTGPEAGFSSKETKLLKEHGAVYASLGPMILRTETAALAAAVIVMHRLGVIG